MNADGAVLTMTMAGEDDDGVNRVHLEGPREEIAKLLHCDVFMKPTRYYVLRPEVADRIAAAEDERDRWAARASVLEERLRRIERIAGSAS